MSGVTAATLRSGHDGAERTALPGPGPMLVNAREHDELFFWGRSGVCSLQPEHLYEDKTADVTNGFPNSLVGYTNAKSHS